MTTDEVTPGLSDAFMLYRLQLAAFLQARCRGNAQGPEVDDLLHELWLRCQGVPIGEIADPRSYLFRAAHNLVVDRGRSAQRGRLYEDAWAFGHRRATDGSEPPVAERRLIARERLAEIDRALNAVGLRAASIFRRYRIEGVSQAIIAAELGVSLSTVEKDLRKAYEAVIAIREVANDD